MDNESDFILASWLQTCDINDAQFESCHLESVRGLFTNVFNGNFKIDGLESVEPMKLDKVQILQGSGGPVALDASLTKLKIFGLSKTEVVQNKLDLQDYSWTTKFKVPKMRLEADYSMKGQILVIPLNVRCLKLFDVLLF